jgi:hypothetical protein
MTTRAYCFIELEGTDTVYSTKDRDYRFPYPMSVPVGRYRLRLKIEIIPSELEMAEYKLFLDADEDHTMLDIKILPDSHARTTFQILPNNIQRTIWYESSGGLDYIDLLSDFEVTPGLKRNSIHIGPFECLVGWLGRVGSPFRVHVKPFVMIFPLLGIYETMVSFP